MTGHVKSKLTNPLIRWEDRLSGNPYKICVYCGNYYTSLGLTRHVNACSLSGVKFASRKKRKSPP